MGLGTVLASDARSVTIVFLASGETRIYAKQTAPLTRVRFAPGDRVPSHHGWILSVERLSEADGLLTYHGQRADGTPASLPEGELDNHIQLNRPGERLLAGQIDPDKWFELRYQTLLAANRLAHSPLFGITGGRTSLIPHQLYIAHEVANRYAPRVLLADEVGLGKTIEAGLILHHQLLTERARRVLVVVPESLQYQWLVEMLRRFNRRFSLFDAERCAESEGDNPFHDEQLVLCSLEFLTAHPAHAAQCAAGEWDLLVVDEAHHLAWSVSAPSVEYRLVEALAAATPGVLLLTATPEQLGKQSHFARLRLLDPDRFPEFDSFQAEEARYAPVANAVAALLGDAPLTADTLDTLHAMAEDSELQLLLTDLQQAPADQAEALRQALVEALLDRHGTGRVLFRNTRSAVQGFPLREVHPHPLPCPPGYAPSPVADIDDLLHPETAQPDTWTREDPRVPWLAARLQALRPAKVLVITARRQTVLALAQALQARHGIQAGVFHEGLRLVERDRAAAWFADREDGCQVLLCSEIGSEGRNFQFAQHLVLFDLPLNPDLLEQRIGRLDRIGQAARIHLHVPYLEGTAQETLFRWYHEGLGAFAHTCPAGHGVYERLRDALLDVLHGRGALDGLLRQARELHAELNAALEAGRDRLLEYNSCRPSLAAGLQQAAEEADAESTLPGYLESVFDAFGVDFELHSSRSYVLHPGNHMQAPLPGLAEDGMTVTYDRHIALANEDRQFLTWEHPLTQGAMDLVLNGELGNTALTAVNCPGFPPGSLLLECVFLLETATGEHLPSARYLPPTTIRIVVDQAGLAHDALPHTSIVRGRGNVPRETAAQVVREYAEVLREMLAAAHKLAEERVPAIRREALQRTRHSLQGEIQRLHALQRVNPNVRASEIDYFEGQWTALNQALETAGLRLDALRVIVCSGEAGSSA